MGHEKENKAASKHAAAQRRVERSPPDTKPITGVPGEWVKLSDRYLNCDNIAFVEETEGAWLTVHMLKDRADRQKLPVRNEKPWRRKTRKLYLMGEDAEIMRKWLRSRAVLIVLPKRKDPDEF